jgi:tRNA uridine 5-carboxymethylaminomethyl modification enzyme
LDIGCVGPERQAAFAEKEAALTSARGMLTGQSLSPNEAAHFGLKINHDGIRRTGFDLLGFADVTFESLRTIWPSLAQINDRIAAQIEIDAKYAVYLRRQDADIAAFRRDEALAIPADLNYALLPGLSNEVRARLETVKPRTMGQASRIEGMTPAALTLLASQVRRVGAK